MLVLLLLLLLLLPGTSTITGTSTSRTSTGSTCALVRSLGCRGIMGVELIEAFERIETPYSIFL
jgi:hypothetical protein